MLSRLNHERVSEPDKEGRGQMFLVAGPSPAGPVATGGFRAERRPVGKVQPGRGSGRQMRQKTVDQMRGSWRLSDKNLAFVLRAKRSQ